MLVGSIGGGLTGPVCERFRRCSSWRPVLGVVAMPAQAAGRLTIRWAAADDDGVLNCVIYNLGSSQKWRRCRAGVASRLASTSAGVLGARRALSSDATALAAAVFGAR